VAHVLVAGATGSGKSVFLNSLLVDLISRGSDARYLLIDPKRVEFAPYRPYITSVLVENEDIVYGLGVVVGQMEERFEKLEAHKVRDIATYNAAQPFDDHMYRIVVVVDELASLMLGPAKDRIEAPLTRLSLMGRAVGIHLVLATQRPTVDVVTGQLKANISARVAFAVVTRTDSAVILDEPGAEDLLGKGQLLARIPGRRGLHLLQGRLTTIEDVDRVIKHYTEVST
jgi:S-DNA-T family DNA segregation ATPase FtsK/SpoIIIE